MGFHTAFYGDATSLYLFSFAHNRWVDVSRTIGGPYKLAPGDHWKFQLSSDSIIAAHGGDIPQIFRFGVSENFENMILH